jgi:hypothetical protein
MKNLSVLMLLCLTACGPTVLIGRAGQQGLNPTDAKEAPTQPTSAASSDSDPAAPTDPNPTGSPSSCPRTSTPCTSLPDLAKVPQLDCVTPTALSAGKEVTLELYGSALQDARGGDSLVDISGTAYSGIPVDNCHLTVTLIAPLTPGTYDLHVTTASMSAPLPISVF